MIEAERVTNNAGQAITVFTTDQQLYRVVLDVICTDQEDKSGEFDCMYGKIGRT